MVKNSLNNTSILVLGMHRSGTSALTRVINLLGVDLGQNLMEARPDNVKGFWEEADIVKLNDEMLSVFGQRWDDIHAFPENWSQSERALEIEKKIVDILSKQFSGSPVWGLKDPRLCRLLPVYTSALNSIGSKAKVIVTIRDPMEVALSLHAREGMPLYYGLLLWIRYVLDAERNSRKMKRVWVAYDELMSNWFTVISSIQKELEINWLLEVEDAAPLIEEFLDPHLHHQRKKDGYTGDSGAIKHLTYEIYDLLRSEEDGQTRQISVDGIAVKLLQLLEMFTDQNSSADDFSTFLQKNVPDFLEPKLQGTALVETRTKMDLRNKLLEAEKIIEAQEVQLVENRETINEGREELRAVIAQRGEIKAQRDEALGWLDYVKSTFSWKITRPFRVCGRIFKGGANCNVRIDGRRISLAYHLFRQHGFRFLMQQVLQRLWRPQLKMKKRQAFSEPTLEELEIIQFSLSVQPKVSIIIPVYNKFEYTFACLKSVFEETLGEYEVIVVDDGSADMTQHIDEYVSGIRLIRNEENLGFVGSCNAGAGIAKGEYLLFLNNDTIVCPDWLNALLEGFEMIPEAGLVGAKLVYPDGRLQEAGGIIWQDASGWNYGRLQDPDAPEFNYLREVDYCSGACILLPRKLFQVLGLFDERYKPAYYEDTDLAFAVRAAGKKVVYQPFAEVIHFEGISSGTDLSSGAKKYQLVNQKKFHEKWETVLQGHLPHGSDPDLACNRVCRKRVLVIDSYTPMPDRDAGSLRMFHILKLFAKMGYKVTFSAENLSFHPQYSNDLRKMGVETICYPYVQNIEDYLKVKGSHFDAVIMSRRDVTEQYIKTVRQWCPNAMVIFDTVDLHFMREAREKEISSDIQIDMHEHAKNSKEIELASQSDEIWVVSEAESTLLKEIDPEIPVHVVSLLHDIQPTTRPFSERQGILFVGSFMHPPNIDAINFYFEHVHSKVRKQIGTVRFYVIGGSPPKKVEQWSQKFPEVQVTGYVEDIKPYFEKVRLSVAPLRFGAGIKGKINSSMSFGVPVVTTSIGAEGMELVHRRNAMIADEAEELAQAIIELHGNEFLWEEIVQAGFRNIQEHFSISLAEKALRESVLEAKG